MLPAYVKRCLLASYIPSYNYFTGYITEILYLYTVAKGINY